MLIIEGSDNLGKTTAAKALVKLAAGHGRYPVRYSHMSRPNDTFDFLHDYQDISSKFAVQDRFHLGGLVWHKEKIGRDALKVIEGRLQALGSLCVIMYTSDAAWYKDHLKLHAKPELFDHEKLIVANEHYQALAEHVAWHDYVFDVRDGKYPGLTEFGQWIQTWYRRLELIGEVRRDDPSLR